MRTSPNKKKKADGASSGAVLLLLTIAFVFSLFFFVTIMAHQALEAGDLNEAPVANKLIRWMEKGEKEIEKVEKFVVETSKKEIGIIEKDIGYLERDIKDFLVVEPYTPTIDASNMNGEQQQRAAHLLEPGYSTVKDPNQKNMTAKAPFHELTCPHGDLLSFWKRTTETDRVYQTPYFDPAAETKYVSFEPDVGGWNNIRMQMELVVVFAYATGRTLVLPPDQPMYLLNKGKGHQKAHSFADFFPFEYIEQRVPVISMKEFLAREAITGGLRNTTTGRVSRPPGNKIEFDATVRAQKLAMWGYLRDVAVCPLWRCMKEFVVIPPAPGVNVTHLSPALAAEYKARQDTFAAGRSAVYYDSDLHAQKLIHFISKPGDGYRLLEHFYTFIHFEDPAMDRFFKRFVRDYIHYIDLIFCKAAKIIKELMLEGKGSYSAFHIRRGEFQYKVVKIPSAKILKNVGQFIPKNQLVFVATDERNKTFFNAFKNHWKEVRFLDDYMDFAGLRKINPNFLGMIDQVICSRADTFVGTWFSTFSGYITRLRGYMGYKDQSNYYGDMKHRDRFQKAELPMFPFYMREWNISWDGIDAV